MKQIYVILLFLFGMTTVMHAQKSYNDTVRIVQGRVLDFVTNEPIPDSIETKIELLTKDSVFVKKGVMSKSTVNFYRPESFFICEINKPGEYILRISNPLYQTAYVPLKIKWYKRERTIQIPVVPLKRRLLMSDNVMLDAVQVKATKVKFYFDKDTLVYNAAAFITQSGFSLNDILEKMPGVEIKDNGEIRVNGRAVSALLLNGKDFFNRDRKTLLENLPAFMVKDVKVYDKTKDSLSLFKREREFEGYVMDVKLKREYSNSAVGNLDFGYGTDNRYYAKAVGLKFNAVHRLSGFIGMNNVNASEIPLFGQDTYTFVNHNGDYTIDLGGLSYNFDNPRGLFSTQGDLKVSYWDGHNATRTSRQQFFDDGDVFSRLSHSDNDYTFRAETSHKFDLFSNTPYDIELKPSFKYETIHGNSIDHSASFSTDVDGLWGEAWLDSLVSDEASNIFNLYGINRNRTVQKQNAHALNVKVEAQKDIKIPHTHDKLDLSASLNFNENIDRSYLLRYIQYQNQAGNNVQNQYAKNSTYNRDALFHAGYNYVLNDYTNLSLKYSFAYLSIDNNNPIYSLHKLAGWDYANGNNFGLLPSQTQMLNVLDGNSQSYNQKNRDQEVSLGYSYSRDVDGKWTQLSVGMPLKIQNRKMDFSRVQYDTLVRQNMTAPDLTVQFSYQNRNFMTQRNMSFSLSYNMDHQMPSLYNLVDITNDRNPLYVTHGNSRLKNVTNHNVSGDWFWQTTKGYVQHANISYTQTLNQIANALVYDKQTGISHVTPCNVNGNKFINLTINNAIYKTRNRGHSLDNELKLGWRRSVDYTTTSVDVTAERSIVRNYSITDNLTYRFRSNDTKVNLMVQGVFFYNHAKGSLPGFVNQNYYVFGWNSELKWELPKDFRFSTELNGLFRRGFVYSDMNDNDMVWNATLTKAFSDRFSLKLTGYDLLGRRKLVTRVVNAQGNEEVYTNAMRRYVMLHFVFRLLPKGTVNMLK